MPLFTYINRIRQSQDQRDSKLYFINDHEISKSAMKL